MGTIVNGKGYIGGFSGPQGKGRPRTEVTIPAYGPQGQKLMQAGQSAGLNNPLRQPPAPPAPPTLGAGASSYFKARPAAGLGRPPQMAGGNPDLEAAEAWKSRYGQYPRWFKG